MTTNKEFIRPAPLAPATPGTGRGTASLVLGICSILAGWTFAAPIIGLILGISSHRREPDAGGRATWGVVLNALALAVWLVVGFVAISAAVLGISNGDLHFH